MLMSALGLFVGYALLAVGLWRTRAAPGGASDLIVAFLVVNIIGLAAGGNKGVLLVAHTLLLGGPGLDWRDGASDVGCTMESRGGNSSSILRARSGLVRTQLTWLYLPLEGCLRDKKRRPGCRCPGPLLG